MGRTHGHAGDLLSAGAVALAGFDVADVLVVEGHKALQNLSGCLIADGAIRAVADHFRQRLHLVQNLHSGLAREDSNQHTLDLTQSVTAGHTLAAGLALGRLQQRELHRNRTGSGRINADLVRELGEEVLLRFAEALKDVSTMESAPKLEGRNMTMILAPLK